MASLDDDTDFNDVLEILESLYAEHTPEDKTAAAVKALSEIFYDDT